MQPLLVRLAPWVVDEDHPAVLRVERLLRVLDHRPVDDLVHRRDAEHEIRVGAVARDRRAGRPRPHERHLRLVHDRHDRERHRRVEPAEEHRHLLLEDQLARGRDAFRRRGLVVAAHELELAALEHTALGVQLVDRDGEPARDGLAGAGRLAGERGDQADLDRLLRRGGQRSRADCGREGDLQKRTSLGHEPLLVEETCPPTQSACHAIGWAGGAVQLRNTRRSRIMPRAPAPVPVRHRGARRTRAAQLSQRVTAPLPETSAHKTPAAPPAVPASTRSDSRTPGASAITTSTGGIT